MPVRKPRAQLVPPSVEAAKPMSDEPPSLKRPVWNADTMVVPLEKVSGSTWVACWLPELVKGSALTWVSARLARAGEAATATALIAAARASDQRAQRAPRAVTDILTPPPIPR